jgi:folylpolyglutamate synthase
MSDPAVAATNVSSFTSVPSNSDSNLNSNSNSNSNSNLTDKKMNRRTYKEAINALNTLQSNFATIDAVRKSGINRNSMLMPEMIEWVRRIGYKPSDFNKLNVIHVTGTKGKGSTCAFVQSIINQYKIPIILSNQTSSNLDNNDINPIDQLNASRSLSTNSIQTEAHSINSVDLSKITKIGLYTSPHLKTVRERIMINGKPISEELFTKYFFDIWNRLDNSKSDSNVFPHMGDGIKPAYFRYLTLLSFHAFMSEGVDTAIYEVGVGGEYDSTNVFESPTACGISALGIDHTIMLGNTIEEIAWNKSGIFKQNSACFTVAQSESALKVIKDRAEEKKVGSFEIVNERSELNEIKLGLNGDFQKQNASLAIALCHAHLTKLGYKIDLDTLPDEFVRGLENAKWPGRCQIVEDPKRKSDLVWFIDGAHTEDSVRNGSYWFTQAANPNKKRVLLFNQQTREPGVLLKTLFEQLEKSNLKFDHVIFTTNVTWSTGDYSDDLVSINTDNNAVASLNVQTQMAEIYNKLDRKARKHLFHDIETSVNFIRTLEGPLEVFVCGSLHLVGGFLVVLDGKN